MISVHLLYLIKTDGINKKIASANAIITRVPIGINLENAKRYTIVNSTKIIKDILFLS